MGFLSGFRMDLTAEFAGMHHRRYPDIGLKFKMPMFGLCWGDPAGSAAQRGEAVIAKSKVWDE